MSKVDLAIDDYEESSGVRLVIARSRGTGSRLYFCASHMGCFFRAKFGRERAKHVHALSATFSKRESDELMAKINAISARGKKYLEGISANQWRSTAWVDDPTLPPRLGIVTTNMSESVNSMVGDARDGSWLECTNDIVRKMMNRICSLREESYIDAVAYYRWFETQTLQYIMDNHVSEHYKYKTVNELLKENIVPVSLDILDQDGVTLPPNRTIRSSGRPRKKRIRKRSRFADDPDKSPIVCSRCKKRGHNVKTYVAREQLEKQHPAGLDLS
ncbi:hypothetical protein IV203_028047 [Nitzschia inconspicua]|uniref:Uncharacterized protein n=1 Tax=Nitzschia inconspicua TaxID=303405 RepID=A0A9K3Q4F0_9STRA|nr:hypothetical protein IV203_028047 [Nitzschia inconspicua]